MLFMSKANLIDNISQFKNALSYDVSAYMDDNRLKKLFYSIMDEVNKAHVNTRFASESARTASLNEISRRVAGDYFSSNLRSAPNQADRLMPFPKAVRNDPTPDVPPEAKTSPMDAFTYERLRSTVYETPPASDPGLASIQENAIGIEETDQLLQQFRQARSDQLEEFQDVTATAQHAQLVDELPHSMGASQAADVVLFPDAVPAQDIDNVPPKPEATKTKMHYVCVNAADRDVRLYPLRSSFRVQLLDPIRNVKKVKISFVQIPMESNVNVQNQTVYNHPLDVAFPYLLLTIDEVPAVYTGNNDYVRRAFSVLTYVRHCIMSNSRGYTTFTPQNEEFIYTSSPLPTLSTLTMSLRYPNGEPYTQARDTNKVQQLDFVPQTNPSASEFGGLLRVMLTSAVGANEYQVNDFIRMSALTVDTNALTSQQKHAVEVLDNYLSRPEGVRVVGVDIANTFGRLQAILVKVPGNLNATTGGWTNDASVLSLFDTVPIITQSDTTIWNMSLQVSVCLQVTAEMPAWTTNPINFG